MFKGLFFVIDFHKDFIGTVYAIPKKEQKQHNGGVKKTNYTGQTLEDVQLENPRFNKEFAIRASDQTLSRYIFTPAFME